MLGLRYQQRCIDNIVLILHHKCHCSYKKNNVALDEDGAVKQGDQIDSLNTFLSKYTSEDNESFEDIMERYSTGI